jgi:hypothetical protein
LRTIATYATLLKKITEIAKNRKHWVAASSTIGKRVENEERMEIIFTYAANADKFVLSSFVTYVRKVGNVFGAFRFKSI